MCELNLRPSYGNKINTNTQIGENNHIYEFVFDATRPWEKEYNKSREITMNNIVYNGGTYYAYIPDHIKEYYEISDDDLALGIFSDKFTIYLDNIQLKIECEVIDIYPVKFLIKYILKGAMIDLNNDELERLIEIKLFRLGKYLKKMENPMYSERAIKILNEDKIRNDLIQYNKEWEQMNSYKDDEGVNNYYLLDEYDYDY